ncbi:MAG: hypothetical protein EBQ89_11425 [Alphaproteobacteria bacterium]|nr:hypothetical protein [Alphaproteobacteria bacterium]
MQMKKFVKCFFKLFSLFEENQGFQRQNLTFEKLSETAICPFFSIEITQILPVFHHRTNTRNTNTSQFAKTSNNKFVIAPNQITIK